ncbi:MAG: hypothetical protein KAR39_13220 [Thermoplasmata archaeon]|nr:hypothetical protein [Thermoplasmata archaeon]
MIDFAYDLKTPIDYHSGSENKEAVSVILSAPSNKQRRAAARLKQFFFQAINDLKTDDQQASDDSKKPKGSEIVALLMMSNIDANDVHDAFKDIAISGCAMLDGAVSMNDSLYEKMSFEDTEEMLGEYLVNFLIPSS